MPGTRIVDQHIIRLLRRTLAVAVLFILAAFASANKFVTWSAVLQPADARAGESAQIVLTAKIAPTWHIYKLKQPPPPQATSVKLASNKTLQQEGDPVQPKPKTIMDPNFGIQVGEFEDSVSIGIPVKIAATASGKQTASVSAMSQACNAHTCAMPETVQVPIDFTIGPGAARADHQKPILTPPTQADAQSAGLTGNTGAPADFNESLALAQKRGLFAFAWFSFLCGLLALLTPCVFPMIPITVSYFAKSTHGEHHKPSHSGAIAYCVGILGAFTGLGLLFTALFGATGIQQLATNPWVNLAFAGVFVILAITLFGALDLRLPSGLLTRSHAATRKSGFIGPVMMGLTFTLTSFTCTVPFVGTILAEAAKENYLFPLVGMLAFSIAFALPFFLLALFPQYLAKLPKSGAWLATLKGFMAFLELAAAVKFLSNADLVWQLGFVTRPVFLSLWAIIAAVSALYLFGVVNIGRHAGAKPKVGILRGAFGVLMLGAAVFCLGGMKGSGSSLGKLTVAFLPPEPYPGTKVVLAKNDIHWVMKYNAALAQAKTEGKSLFIDFTGVTCTNCRYMEQNIFPVPEVRKLIDDYIPVQLYTDRATDEDRSNAKLEQQLSEQVTLPEYVIVNPDGKPVKTFGGSTYDASEFAKFLRP